MASLLTGSLRKQIASGFKSKLLIGTLTREVPGGLDQYGDPTTEPQTFRVEGFHESYDEKYRAQAGIPITDSKIILILGNCQTDPIKEDVISFPGYKPYKVRAVKMDPAKASAELQVFEIQ